MCREGWQHGEEAKAVSCLKDAVSLNKHASLWTPSLSFSLDYMWLQTQQQNNSLTDMKSYFSYSEDLMLLCNERTKVS